MYKIAKGNTILETATPPSTQEEDWKAYKNSIDVKVTGVQIIDQLTDAEILAINSSTNATVLRWYMKALSTKELINLNAPETSAGMAALVEDGILSSARISQIILNLKA